MRHLLLDFWPFIYFALSLALIALVRRRRAARPVVVQQPGKKRKGKKRKGVDRNGWPREINV